MPDGTGTQRMRGFLWTALVGLCLLAFACFAFPMYIIRPFRGQGATELSMALAVRQWGPWLAFLCAAASLAALALLLVRASGPGARAGAAALTALTGLSAGLSRVNVYELMFHPVPKPGFAAAAQARVDGDDMVLTVSIAGEARAYPIRTMGYHHIVNDWVGGAPIVATY